MRPKRFILLIVIAIFSLSSEPVVYHSVRFVHDGDTILLDEGERLRYLGIDAPEIDYETGKSEYMAHAARNLNRKLVDRHQVKLEYDQEKRDAHGRLLAYVFLENGDMVNAVLLRQGLANVMLKSPNLKYKAYLVDCQRKAMREKLGIWRDPAKVEEKLYLGNRRSYRFHRPNCHFGRRISRRNLVRFPSRYDAFWAGYSPCKRCEP
jgi:micrococcal nuclease